MAIACDVMSPAFLAIKPFVNISSLKNNLRKVIENPDEDVYSGGDRYQSPFVDANITPLMHDVINEAYAFYRRCGSESFHDPHILYGIVKVRSSAYQALNSSKRHRKEMQEVTELIKHNLEKDFGISEIPGMQSLAIAKFLDVEYIY